MYVIIGRGLGYATMWILIAATSAACGAIAQSPTPASSRTSATGTQAEGDAAVWVLAPGSAIEGSSTRFTAIVSRLGCNNGITGQVQAPDINIGDSEIVVIFTVAPEELSAANCLGNEEVAYEVDLGEPLLDRRLVDGQCLPGAEAVTTSWCVPESARYAP